MEYLNNYSTKMLPYLEKEMRTVLNLNGPPTNQFYGMLHYHMGWVDQALRPIEGQSGKRIRPLLCLLTCEAAGGDWQHAIPAAAAIEILHNFSLIHDDIEDASPTRRGRETVWKLWGIEQAINAGDAMFVLAHLAMAELPNRGVSAEITVESMRRFDETCLLLTQGQHEDMSFELQDNVSVSDYIQMITGKTAVLLSLCSELGAKIAGTDAETAHHFTQFGLCSGLAFQVIDDILGIWGNENRTGKSTATDILTKKKTLPILYGFENDAALFRLYQATEQPSEGFVSQVINRLNTVGAHDFARQKASEYAASALSHLAAAHPAGEAGKALYELADMLLKRDY